MLKLLPKPKPLPGTRKPLPRWLPIVLELPVVAALSALLLRGDRESEPRRSGFEATGIRYAVSAEEWPQGTNLRFLADRYGGDLAAMRALNPPGAGCANPDDRIEPGDVVTIAFSAQNVECEEAGSAPSPVSNISEPDRSGANNVR